ncbi:MAG: xanthine dehydrogenase accessory protein XdhC [Syntrophobacterales bacterium CG_4_8_14_3_um_filter_49_14]|nr:MAG: xanthine dehydrogenase accessory protein XdhC [Syntrophobacterales bacterium CG_4_8_14_3_um_filter_49_14]
MDIFEEIVAAKKSNVPVVLATVIESLGSAPREEGARMLIKSDGSIVGTIGGGAIEKKIIDEAMTLMNAPASKLVRYELEDIGMACGGGMSVFLEPIRQLPQLIIFGAGHIGKALSQLGKMLDFVVTVVDNRQEFANKERLPWVDTVIAEDYQQVIDKLHYSDNMYMVILTHKHTHDFEILEQLIHKPFHYLGMIGSKTKVAKEFQQLRDKGISKNSTQKIHSPIGISIGANTPAEIAISIAAELVAVRSSAQVSHLTTCSETK